jgi:hypothetical protein
MESTAPLEPDAGSVVGRFRGETGSAPTNSPGVRSDVADSLGATGSDRSDVADWLGATEREPDSAAVMTTEN